MLLRTTAGWIHVEHWCLFVKDTGSTPVTGSNFRRLASLETLTKLAPQWIKNYVSWPSTFWMMETESQTKHSSVSMNWRTKRHQTPVMTFSTPSVLLMVVFSCLRTTVWRPNYYLFTWPDGEIGYHNALLMHCSGFKSRSGYQLQNVIFWPEA